jgi:hypothetical protein
MVTAREAASVAARLLALTVLTLAMSAGTAGAKPSKYSFHVGDGFAGIASPETSAASNGDTITISSTGKFHVASHKASGGGTFEHRASGGTLLASGNFTVLRVTSFDPFGCGVAEGEPLPSNFCGGLVVLPVHVVGHPVAGGTEEFNAVMTITCLVGDRIPPGLEENVAFAIPGLIDFDQPVSGENLFVKKNVNKNKRNE